ncbi:hypothetical protein GCM10027321_15480 [Massilia terrae]
MQPQRLVPVLQSVAEVRNWVVGHVPLTDSLLGYDLFIKFGNDVLARQPLDTDSIAAGLPYPQQHVAAQLNRMAAAGLVTLVHEGGKCLAQPTAAFLDLLDTYSKMFDRLFIVRSDLRQKQLVVAVSDAELADFAQVLYDRVYDLGWVYLHNFGSACFLMSSLVQRIAAEHGHDARILSCHVNISAPGSNFKLGAPGMAKPGQIDGHAAVVINETAVIDFGLGNIRKGYRRDFPWGAAFDYRRDGPVFGALQAAANETVTWLDDWQSPGTQTELDRYAPHIDALYGDYAARFLG